MFVKITYRCIKDVKFDDDDVIFTAGKDYEAVITAGGGHARAVGDDGCTWDLWDKRESTIAEIAMANDWFNAHFIDQFARG